MRVLPRKRIASVVAKRDAVMQSGEQEDDAIFEIGNGDAGVELTEQGVRESHVIAAADVAQAGDKKFQQVGFGEIAKAFLECGDGSCLRAQAGLQASPLGARKVRAPSMALLTARAAISQFENGKASRWP